MWNTLKNFFTTLLKFIQKVANDNRIPKRDKKFILILVAYIISPFDLIPDWIPILGLLDDVLALSLILDYLFNILDNKILLSHFPWGMKTFSSIRRIARAITIFTPAFIKNKMWKYVGDPYSRY